MEHLLIALCVIALLAMAVAFMVFRPVVITVDSHQRHIRVRWLMVLEYLLSLPGGAGESGFYFLQKPVAFGVRGARRKKRLAKMPKKRRLPVQFLKRCMGDSAIRGKLALQMWKLLKVLFRSAELARWEGEVSLPDPALNGMLAGALAGLPGRMGVRVNFTGANSLFMELRLYPLRILKGFLFFGSRLPYWAILKQWRAFSATRPR